MSDLAHRIADWRSKVIVTSKISDETLNILSDAGFVFFDPIICGDNPIRNIKDALSDFVNLSFILNTPLGEELVDMSVCQHDDLNEIMLRLSDKLPYTICFRLIYNNFTPDFLKFLDEFKKNELDIVIVIINDEMV